MVPLVILKNGRNHSIKMIKTALESVGLRVLVSFDSRQTQANNTNINCPHHGTAVCDCRIVVLLVYGTEGRPASVVVYGQAEEMRVSLIYPPGLRPSLTLQNQIKATLNSSLLQT